MGRTALKPDPKETKVLVRLIARHHGNLSAIAKARSTTRQAIARRLKLHDLSERADRARAAAGVRGPRPKVTPEETTAAERQRLVRALVKHGGYRPAAAALGIGKRTMARKMRQLRITPEEVQTLRSS